MWPSTRTFPSSRRRWRASSRRRPACHPGCVVGEAVRQGYRIADCLAGSCLNTLRPHREGRSACLVGVDRLLTEPPAAQERGAVPPRLVDDARIAREYMRRQRPTRCSRCANTRNPSCSSVQPNFLHAPTIVDAVHHDRHILHLWSPTGTAAHVIDHRTHSILCQLAVDLPGDQLALLLVPFG